MAGQPFLNGGMAASPALIPMGHHQGKPPIPLTRPVTLIGARQNAHIHLLSRSISKAHALLIQSDNQVFIHDLASRTHVIINGEQISQAVLNEGDEIVVGSFTFQFMAGPPTGRRPHDRKPPAGQLTVEGDLEPVRLNGRVLLIGRRAGSDILIPHGDVSTSHAVVFLMNGRHYVRDLGSRSGTFVNEQLVRQSELKFGDTIRIGPTELKYGEAAEEIEEFAGLSDDAIAPSGDLDDLIAVEPVARAPVKQPPPPPEFIPLELDFAPLEVAGPEEAVEAAEEVMPAGRAAKDDLGLELEPEPAHRGRPAIDEGSIPLDVELAPSAVADIDESIDVEPVMSARGGWRAAFENERLAEAPVESTEDEISLDQAEEAAEEEVAPVAEAAPVVEIAPAVAGEDDLEFEEEVAEVPAAVVEQQVDAAIPVAEAPTGEDALELAPEEAAVETWEAEEVVAETPVEAVPAAEEAVELDPIEIAAQEPVETASPDLTQDAPAPVLAAEAPVVEPAEMDGLELADEPVVEVEATAPEEATPELEPLELEPAPAEVEEEALAINEPEAVVTEDAVPPVEMDLADEAAVEEAPVEVAVEGVTADPLALEIEGTEDVAVVEEPAEPVVAEELAHEQTAHEPGGHEEAALPEVVAVDEPEIVEAAREEAEIVETTPHVFAEGLSAAEAEAPVEIVTSEAPAVVGAALTPVTADDWFEDVLEEPEPTVALSLENADVVAADAGETELLLVDSLEGPGSVSVTPPSAEGGFVGSAEVWPPVAVHTTVESSDGDDLSFLDELGLAPEEPAMSGETPLDLGMVESELSSPEPVADEAVGDSSDLGGQTIVVDMSARESADEVAEVATEFDPEMLSGWELKSGETPLSMVPQAAAEEGPTAVAELDDVNFGDLQFDQGEEHQHVEPIVLGSTGLEALDAMELDESFRHPELQLGLTARESALEPVGEMSMTHQPPAEPSAEIVVPAFEVDEEVVAEEPPAAQDAAPPFIGEPQPAKREKRSWFGWGKKKKVTDEGILPEEVSRTPAWSTQPSMATMGEVIGEAPISEVDETSEVEVIESTDPTADSALSGVTEALEEAQNAEHTEEQPVPPADLTDTSFGRMIEDFSGGEGDLVEDHAGHATPTHDEPTAEAAAPNEKSSHFDFDDVLGLTAKAGGSVDEAIGAEFSRRGAKEPEIEQEAIGADELLTPASGEDELDFEDVLGVGAGRAEVPADNGEISEDAVPPVLDELHFDDALPGEGAAIDDELEITEIFDAPPAPVISSDNRHSSVKMSPLDEVLGAAGGTLRPHGNQQGTSPAVEPQAPNGFVGPAEVPSPASARERGVSLTPAAPSNITAPPDLGGRTSPVRQEPPAATPAPTAPVDAPAGAGANFNYGNDQSSFLGGMTLRLPDLNKPASFGKVRVVFGDKAIPADVFSDRSVMPAGRRSVEDEGETVRTQPGAKPAGPVRAEKPIEVKVTPVAPLEDIERHAPTPVDQDFQDALAGGLELEAGGGATDEDAVNDVLGLGGDELGAEHTAFEPGVEETFEPVGHEEPASDEEQAMDVGAHQFGTAEFDPEEPFADAALGLAEEPQIEETPRQAGRMPSRPVRLVENNPINDAFGAASVGEEDENGDGDTGHGFAPTSGNGDNEQPASARPMRAPLKPAVPPRVSQLQGQPGLPRRSGHSHTRRNWMALWIVLLVVCIVAAAFGIMKYMLPKVSVNGTLRFDHYADASPEKQKLVKQSEEQLIQDDTVLAQARRIFRTMGDADAGFLGDPVALKKVTAKFEADKEGAGASMLVSYAGRGTGEDALRLQALLRAMYESNNSKTFLEEWRLNNSKLQATRDQIISQEAYVKQLKAEVEKMTSQGDAAPEKSAVAAARALQDEAHQKYEAAATLTNNLSSELARLRQVTPDSPEKPAVPADTELASLETELTKLNDQLVTGKTRTTEAAAQARKTLDDAMQQFQEEVKKAQGLKDVSGLEAYIDSAKQLHKATLKYSNDLLEREQGYQETLTDLKGHLEEVMESKRQEKWAADPELQRLQQLLELRTREFNAVSASPLSDAKEKAKAKQDVDTLTQQIQGQKLLAGSDKAMDQLAEYLNRHIKSIATQIENDRASSEKSMQDLEARVAQSAPAVEKLRQTQPELAEVLQKKADGMLQARAVYARTVEAQADEVSPDMKGRAEELKRQIADHKSAAALAVAKTQGQQQFAAAMAKEVELKKAKAAQALAYKEYEGKMQDWATKQAARAQEELSRGPLDEKRSLQQAEDGKLKSLNMEKERLAAAVSNAVEPMPLVAEGVHANVEDHRGLYIAATEGGLVVLFAGLMMLTLLSSPGEPTHARDHGVHSADPVPAVAIDEPAEHVEESRPRLAV